MHMYEISNSSCTCSPDLAALWPLIQEIFNKMCESSKNAKVYSLSWYHCTREMIFNRAPSEVTLCGPISVMVLAIPL